MRNRIRLYDGKLIPNIANAFFMEHNIDKANIIRYNHKKVEIGYALLNAKRGAIFVLTDTLGAFLGIDSINLFYKEPTPVNIVVARNDGWLKHFKSLESCCTFFNIESDKVLELINTGEEFRVNIEGYYFDEDFY